MDMHSGGSSKEKWEYIYIEAPKNRAVVIFYNRFGHNPYRVTCTCCGEDYVVYEYETFTEASAYDRGCRWDKSAKRYIEEARRPRGIHNIYQTEDEYKSSKEVLVIPASEINPRECEGDVPKQGYVWIN